MLRHASRGLWRSFEGARRLRTTDIEVADACPLTASVPEDVADTDAKLQEQHRLAELVLTEASLDEEQAELLDAPLRDNFRDKIALKMVI